MVMGLKALTIDDLQAKITTVSCYFAQNCRIRMKILQLAPRPVFPPDDGGRISIVNVTRHLLRRSAELTLLCLDDRSTEEMLDLDGHSLRVLHVKKDRRNTPVKLLRSLVDSESLYMRKHYSPELLDECLRVLHFEAFDLIHADHTAMASLAFALGDRLSVPVGLRLHNVEYKIWERYAERFAPWMPQRLYMHSQARMLARAEAAAISRADVVFPISTVDLEAARRLEPEGHFVLAPAGVNVEEWTPPIGNHREAHTLVMASAWNWTHNVDGAKWFLQEVYPLVKKVIPDTRLLIPGRGAEQLFGQLNDPSIELPGYVQSMQEWYHRGSVFVVPLFVGSGVRIKIPEAMAAGLVVVATPIGAEGVEAGEEQGLFRRDTANAMVDCIVELLKDEPRCSQRSEAAQVFVGQKMTWRSSIDAMYEAYQELLKTRHG